MSDSLDVVALEAIVRAADEYGLWRERMRPCIAYYLDGNLLDGVARHKVAFALAVALRELTGADEARMREILASWARTIGYPVNETRDKLRSALRKERGEWKYRAPGLKKNGPTYRETLQPVCEAVGCPGNCPRYRSVYAGPSGETFARFHKLGWPERLRTKRQHAAVAVYRAICEVEKERGFGAGSTLYVTYDQLARIAGVDKTTVGRALRQLSECGLITFVPGFGAGPNARNRKASEVARVVPIPTPHRADKAAPITPITTGGVTQPLMGGVTQPETPPIYGLHKRRLGEPWGGLMARRRRGVA